MLSHVGTLLRHWIVTPLYHVFLEEHDFYFPFNPHMEVCGLKRMPTFGTLIHEQSFFQGFKILSLEKRQSDKVAKRNTNTFHFLDTDNNIPTEVNCPTLL